MGAVFRCEAVFCCDDFFSCEVVSRCDDFSRTGDFSRTCAIAKAAAEDHPSALGTGFGPHIDKQVGGPHYLLIVFDDNNGVAQVAKALQDRDKSLSITGMQTYRRFIEYIHRTHQRTAQGGHQIDSLTLAAAQTVRAAVQGQIGQTHVGNIAKPRQHLVYGLAGNIPVRFA